MKWYVIYVYSGNEIRIKKILHNLILDSKESNLFGTIFVPIERIIDLQKNKHRYTKIFPGYIIIQVTLNKNSWNLIKRAPKILKILSAVDNIPKALSSREIKSMLKTMYIYTDNKKDLLSFKKGDNIIINNGPFFNFEGTVKSFYKNNLNITTSIFYRYINMQINTSKIK